jgi:hypothetical protein
MQSVLHFLKATSVFLIILAVAAPGISGMVLCVGPSGHISVETEHQGHCHGSEDGVAGDTFLLPTAEDDCCQGCIDVELSSENVLPLTEVAQRDQVRPPCDASAAPTAPCGHAAAADRLPVPSPTVAAQPSPGLQVKATVVFLA